MSVSFPLSTNTSDIAALAYAAAVSINQASLFSLHRITLRRSWVAPEFSVFAGLSSTSLLLFLPLLLLPANLVYLFILFF
jgi:hypothetical protein